MLATVRNSPDTPEGTARRDRAIAELIDINRPLVKLAARRKGSRLSYQERCSYAIDGLVEAITRYRPEKGTFAGYAFFAINTAIKAASARLAYPSRLPVRLLGVASERPYSPWGRAAAGMQIERAQPAVAADRHEDSRATPETAMTASPFPVARSAAPEPIFDPAPAPDAAMAAGQEWDAARGALAGALDRMKPWPREVLRMRFGFEGPALTLKQTADRIGLSRQEVLGIEARALRGLMPAMSAFRPLVAEGHCPDPVR